MNSAALCLLASTFLVSAAGCTQTLAGPNLGLWSYPVPLSPYFQKREEDAYWNHLRYERAVILGPLPPGPRISAWMRPSEDEVMRDLEKARPVQGGIPLLHEGQRNNVRIISEFRSPTTSIRPASCPWSARSRSTT